MTLTGPIIKSKELNDEFGRFKDKGLAQDTSGNEDTGLLEDLRLVNQSDANHSNVTLNWNYVYRAFNTLDVGTETYDLERDQLFYRAPDDFQVLAVIPDFWGVDRIGYNASIAAGPAFMLPSKRFVVRLVVKGSFTKLDEERGIPVIYKSSEFNLIKDIKMIFDKEDSKVFLRKRSGALDPIDTLGPNAVSGIGSETPTIGTSGQTIDGIPRKLYYPFKEDEPLFCLLRGATYIFTISFTDEEGFVLKDSSNVNALHPITSAQITLVARHFRRRYA